MARDWAKLRPGPGCGKMLIICAANAIIKGYFLNRKNPKRQMSCKPCQKKELETQCDALARELVFLRDRFRCRRCRGEGVQWAHFIGRANWAVRWNTFNALSLCNDCRKWAHKYPLAFKSFMVKEIGIDDINKLNEIARTYFKRSIENLESIKQELLREFNGLKNG